MHLGRTETHKLLHDQPKHDRKLMEWGQKECSLKHSAVTKTSGNPTVTLNLVLLHFFKIIEKICKLSNISFGHL